MIRKTAETVVEQGEGMKPTVEMVASAYEPCINCSAHLVEIRHCEKQGSLKALFILLRILRLLLCDKYGETYRWAEYS